MVADFGYIALRKSRLSGYPQVLVDELSFLVIDIVVSMVGIDMIKVRKSVISSFSVRF